MTRPQERERIPKVWGSEEIICNREHAGKAMTLRKGFRCSLHYHGVKDETFLITSGRVRVEIGDAGGMARYTVRQGRVIGADVDEILRLCRVFVLGPGESIDVPPCTIHRFTGLDDATFTEFSTHDDARDSYRLVESGPDAD